MEKLNSIRNNIDDLNAILEGGKYRNYLIRYRSSESKIYEDVRKIYTDRCADLLLLDLEKLNHSQAAQLEAQVDKLKKSIEKGESFVQDVIDLDKARRSTHVSGNRDLKKSDFNEIIGAMGNLADTFERLKVSLTENINVFYDGKSLRQRHEEFIDLKKQLDEFKDKYAEELKELQHTRETVDVISKDLSPKHYASHFQRRADDHKKYARYWLSFSIVLCVVTILGIWIIPLPTEPTNTATLAYEILKKTMTISIFIASAVWSAKVYATHSHLLIVNSHRQITLTTFGGFIKTAVDDNTKDLMLLEVAKTAFAPAPTGYLHDKSELTTHVPDVVKAVVGRVTTPNEGG